MKTLIYLTLLFLQLDVIAQNTWTAKAHLPGTGLIGAVSFSIGNKGYVVTGDRLVGGMSEGSNLLYEYDPATNAWSTKANFPGAVRNYAVGFAIGNKGYVATGTAINGNVLSDLWEWDQDANTWSQKASFPGGGRKFAVGFAVGNKGYLGTGWDQAMDLRKDFWEYDPATNVWSQKAEFPRICYASAGFVIGNKGYVSPGYDGFTLPFQNDFYEFDPVANTWTAKANLPMTCTMNESGRTMAFSFAIGNKGFIGTGTYVNPNVSLMPLYCEDFWEYDQFTDTWTQRASFPGGNRQWSIGFAVGNKGYAGLGEQSMDYFNDLWEYTSDSAGNTTAIAGGEISDLIKVAYDGSKIDVSGVHANTQIEIYNSSGAVVYRGVSVQPRYSIPTELWNSGLYFIRVCNPNGYSVQKLFVE